jgi:hypothetical protein
MGCCIDHDVIGSLASITAGGSSHELVRVASSSISRSKKEDLGPQTRTSRSVWRKWWSRQSLSS